MIFAKLYSNIKFDGRQLKNCISDFSCRQNIPASQSRRKIFNVRQIIELDCIFTYYRNRASLVVDRSTPEFEEDLLLLGDVRRRSQNSDHRSGSWRNHRYRLASRDWWSIDFAPWSTLREEMEYGSRHWSTSGSEQMDSAIRQQACVS